MVIVLLATNTQTSNTDALAKVSIPLLTVNAHETLPKTSSSGSIGISPISTTGSAIDYQRSFYVLYCITDCYYKE